MDPPCLLGEEQLSHPSPAGKVSLSMNTDCHTSWGLPCPMAKHYASVSRKPRRRWFHLLFISRTLDRLVCWQRRHPIGHASRAFVSCTSAWRKRIWAN